MISIVFFGFFFRWFFVKEMRRKKRLCWFSRAKNVVVCACVPQHWKEEEAKSRLPHARAVCCPKAVEQEKASAEKQARSQQCSTRLPSDVRSYFVYIVLVLAFYLLLLLLCDAALWCMYPRQGCTRDRPSELGGSTRPWRLCGCRCSR